MSNKIVVGGLFGDCGKGLVTDYLCSQSSNPLVVRFSGGHQAAHNVVYNGIRHIFSSFGSGSLRGVPTYISKFCTVSPIAICNEYNILVNKGITPNLYIDKDCPIITPYDKQYNICMDRETKHGTCGVGFGSTIEREEKNYHLTFTDLFYPSILKIKLRMIEDWYNLEESTPADMLDCFYDCIKILVTNKNISLVDSSILKSNEYTDIIYEGSQGLLLDKDIGFFPHVTRSNTGTKNIIELNKNQTWKKGRPDHYNTYYYIVTRAYQTRHGNGPMTNENIPHNIKINPNETNVTNKYQGEFRRSLLDLDLLKYGIEKDGNIKPSEATLVITCLDHIVNEYRFTCDGKIVNCNNEEDFVKKVATNLCCNNVLLSHSDESNNITKVDYI